MTPQTPYRDDELTRAIRSWSGERAPTGDDGAGVAAIARAFTQHGIPIGMAARAAAILHACGISDNDTWRGTHADLINLAPPIGSGVKHHRMTSASAGRDRFEIDVGQVYRTAVAQARSMRHARAL